MNTKLLGQLFLTFAKVGVMTFGGGMAMLPILQREVVEDKGWATDEELVDYFAIGQCTPGTIAVNTATFVGQKQAGILGGIAARWASCSRPLSSLRRWRASSTASPIWRGCSTPSRASVCACAC